MPLLSQPIYMYPSSAPEAIAFPRSTPPTKIRVTPSTPVTVNYQYRRRIVNPLILSECRGALYQFTTDALLAFSSATSTSARFSMKETEILAPLFHNDGIKNYASLATWLSDVVKQHGGGPQFTFHPYDRPVAEDYGHKKFQYGLKPSLSAAFSSRPIDGVFMLYWRNLCMPVESRDNPAECLSQALMYAAMVLGTGLRWWCPVLVIDHQHKIARMAFCTRAGVFISEHLKLSVPDQCLRFVRLLRWYVRLEPEEAGYDRSVRHEDGKLFFALPNAAAAEGFDWWEVEKALYKTSSLRGRTTSVYRLRLKPQVSTAVDPALKDVDNQMSNLRLASGSHDETARTTELRDPTPAPTPPASKPVSSHPTNIRPSFSIKSPTHYITDNELHWREKRPEFVIMKDSSPLAARAKIETEFLQAMQGQHGFPEFLGGFTVSDPLRFLDIPGLTQCMDFPDAIDAGGMSREERVRRRVFTATEGIPLTSVKDVRDIAYACVDALIGLLHAYRLNWLHRDVSIGNILYRCEAETREEAGQIDILEEIARRNRPEGESADVNFAFLKDHLKQCKCMIIDGDLAVRMDDKREIASFKSGTLPFMSERVLRASIEKRPPLHCALDDMESVVWLFIWVLVCRETEGEERTEGEEQLVAKLNTHNIYQLVVIKSVFLSQPVDSIRSTALRPSNRPATSLVIDWLKVVNEARNEAKSLFLTEERKKSGGRIWRWIEAEDIDQAKLRALTYKYFQRYLEIGVKFLKRKNVYGL